MRNAPTFPPLLSGHHVDAVADPVLTAIDGAKNGGFGAGDLIFAEDDDTCRFALVLQPEVSRSRCFEVLFTVMVAFGDSAGALCPPETPVTYRWPSEILINGATIGRADLILPDCKGDEIPEWMVVSLRIRVRPDLSIADPGNNPDRTTMWDEGCGEVTSLALLESVSRHIVHALHHWEEDGFRPIHDQWMGRLDERKALADGVSGGGSPSLKGMSDNGSAIISGEGGSIETSVEDALGALRDGAGA